MEKIIDIADLDCIYLSYDEPQKEEFWLKIKNMIPWAKRVDGVKGSDAAHKAAALASNTERFILIDGDNMPNEEFFNLQLDFSNLDPLMEQSQFRWKATNVINGLRYGNGGISSWTKTYVANMKTHENQLEGDHKRITDFCMDSNDQLYHAMWDCYSVTYPNFTPFQAWRAGFREGVKMCLISGTKPSLKDFKEKVSSRNFDNLTIWHNVGSDVENGYYAMLGARYGTFKTMMTDWNYTKVQWFDNLNELWHEFKGFSIERIIQESEEIGKILKTNLDLPICTMNPEQSKFFKRHYQSDKYNVGPLVREMDVIRKIQGW